MDTPPTNHLSFCAGYGGIDLALKSVVQTCRTIAYVEIEAFAIANLVAKMEAGELDQAPVWTDVKTFPAEDFHGLVDIISGGYPCQPFSAAGKRLGTEDPRHLWPFLRRAIRAIRPGRVFLENVEGHISLGLPTVLSDLDEDGYDATWGIFSAAEVGASHQRKRVFILANGKCAGLEGYAGDEQDETGSERTGPGRSVGPSGLPQRFPARPGQPQFDWEEPRVTGQVSQKLADFCAGDERARRDTTSSGGESVGEQRTSDNPSSDGGSSVCGGDQEEELGNPGSAESCGLPDEARPDVPEIGDANRRQAEPQLGRATDGSPGRVDATSHRVDRLRLLGNGVVPATAAKAWTVLSDRFE